MATQEQSAETSAPIVRNGVPERVEQLIAALDQRRFGDAPDRWVANVLGVHIDGAELWVQVARGSDLSKTLVLHLSSWAKPQHAIAALAALSDPGGASSQRIEVMQPMSRT